MQLIGSRVVAKATTTKQPAAQVPFARQAAKLKAERAPDAHGARAPPVRLLGKAEILQITGVTFPTIWAWMRGEGGTFPRSRIVGGKSMWRSDEIDQWLAGLPVRPLKGDASPEQKIEEQEPA
jgi:predicted DNA-binding transcriptional regulator AlpA